MATRGRMTARRNTRARGRTLNRGQRSALTKGIGRDLYAAMRADGETTRDRNRKRGGRLFNKPRQKQVKRELQGKRGS